MSPYRCQGPDEEDLTSAVREKAESRETNIFHLKNDAGSKKRRRDGDLMTIVVYCGEGHKNVFEVKRGEF